MNYLRPDLITRLAAEYVLGTLQGLARRRFERLQKEHDMIRRQVRLWQQHLDPLSMGLTPVRPPARVWQGIAVSLRLPQTAPPSTNWWQSLSFWRLSSLFSTVAAIVLAVLVVIERPAPQTEPGKLVAVLSNAQAEPVLLARFDGSSGRLRLASIGSFKAAPGKDHELWALPEGSAPVSLGVMSQQGEVELVLDARRLAELQRSGALAVSLEPSGGSPTGAPTGPVLLTGKLRLS